MHMPNPNSYNHRDQTSDGNKAHYEAERFWLMLRSLMHGMDSFQIEETILPMIQTRIDSAAMLKMPFLLTYYQACDACVRDAITNMHIEQYLAS